MRAATPGLLDPVHTALVVVDVQERFAPVMSEFDRLTTACERLAKVFHLLGLPVLATEQYPRGLGATVEPLRGAIGAAIPDKTCFSAYGCGAIPDALRDANTRSVLVCGIETHVCINQTVHDLLAAGLETHVAVDAVLSRDGRETDREVALRRMERAGAVLTTSEAAAFELMRDAQHPQFKDVQKLFK